MNNTLLKHILQDTYIKNQAEKKIIVLKNYLLNDIFTVGDKTAIKKTITNDTELDMWVKSLDKKMLASVTPQNIYSIFEDMETNIKASEPLILYLPYDLPETEITKIGTQLRSDYGPNFLMEITIDPNLIAGCALSFKGIYKDYSIKQKIADNKQAILSTFKNYVKH